MSFRPVTTRASRRTQLDASCSSGSSSAPRNNRRGSFELPPGLAYFRTKKAGRRSAALRKGDALHGYHSTRLPAPCAVYIREGTVESEEEFEKSVVPVVQPGNTNLADIIDPVKDDMEQMKVNLRNVVGERHPMLMAAADQIFGAGGKRLRPMLCFLVAKATNDAMGLSTLATEQQRLAEITEMIHTASLVHDDVLDECNVRRGAETVNSMYGTRVAVLAGDFLFAQSSWFLANLDNLEVIKLISQVIADFANGEISQAASLFDTDITMEEYMDKSFYKTASLIAASCKSAAVFSGCDVEMKNAMFEYGRHLGLAFQVVDDILDFTQTAEQLGKPQGQDLASGNLTAPVLFALKESDELREIIDSEFEEDGSLDRALAIIGEVGGIDASFRLAREEADLALASLECLPDSRYKASLSMMVSYVLDRLY